MKKYVIREVAWIHDDHSYTNEGEWYIDSIYDEKSQAESRLNTLQINRCRRDLYLLPRFILGTNEQETVKKRRAFYRFCFEELGVNPTVLFFTNQYISDVQFPFYPSDEQINSLLNILDLEFYKLVEFNDSDLYLYKALLPYRKSKTNPEFKYYLKDLVTEHTKYFDSLNDVITISYKEYFGRVIIKGDLEDISDYPSLLQRHIEKSNYVHYVNGEIHLDSNAPDSDIIMMHGLFSKPPIVPEKVFFEGEKSEIIRPVELEKNDDDSFTANSIIIDLEKVKSSFEYIKNFYAFLPKKMKEYYFDFLRENHIEEDFTTDEHGRLYYKGCSFFLAGVIFNCVTESNFVRLDSMFKIDTETLAGGFMWSKFDNVTTGKGLDIENAFYESFLNWLKINGVDQTVRIKEKIRRTLAS